MEGSIVAPGAERTGTFTTSFCPVVTVASRTIWQSPSESGPPGPLLVVGAGKALTFTGGAGAGKARFLDASGGNILLELDTGSNSNMTNVILPGEGILFPNGVWYTSVSVAPLGITVCYG